MDTPTQFLLGASIGLAGFHRQLGTKALWYGGFCGLFPDFDVVLGMGDDWAGLRLHRAFTHSLVVLPFLSVAMGAIANRLTRVGRASTWIHLSFWALITHPLLDTCTVYGTQLLSPLSDQRFGWDVVAILDPLYSIWLFLAVISVRTLRRHPERIAARARMALVASSLYLGLQGAGSAWLVQKARKSLADQGFDAVRVRTPPPLVFSPTRRIAARDAQGRIAVSAFSFLTPRPFEWHFVEPNPDPRVQAVMETDEAQTMAWFADGFLRFEIHEGEPTEIVMHDLRYATLRDPMVALFRAVAILDGSEVREVRFQDPGSAALDPAAELQAGLDLLLEGRAGSASGG